jgi:hypothetical protein
MQFHDYQYLFHKVGGQDVKFEASDQDTTAADLQYFGFLSASGSWIIQRFKITGSIIEYRYAGGQDNYSASWTAKATWAESVWKYYNQLSYL